MSTLREDWRRWKAGARIHPGWTPLCFFSGAAMMRDLRLGLLVGLSLSLLVVTSCISVYKANYAYAGEDDDMGGTKPSDPDDGVDDE